MRAAEHVLKYLSGTCADRIYYGKDSQQLNKLWGWVDADFADLQILTVEGLTWDICSGDRAFAQHLK